MSVTKAIIPAAGYGTRFLPATKNVPKELLPIIDTPTIHYIVEECVKSGIKDIVIVTRYGNHQIEDYFDSLTELETFLEKNGKYEKLESVRHTSSMANIAFVRQHKSLPYGNASPLISARPFIGNDSFALAWGDSITRSKVPVLKQLIEAFDSSSVDAIIAATKASKEDITKSANIEFESLNTRKVKRIIEKPDINSQISEYKGIGRYVFSSKIFKYIDPNQLGKDKELWLIDAVDRLVQNGTVLAHIIEGEYLTTGDPFNMIRTTLELALDREDLRDKLLNYLRQKVS